MAASPTKKLRTRYITSKARAVDAVVRSFVYYEVLIQITNLKIDYQQIAKLRTIEGMDVTWNRELVFYKDCLFIILRCHTMPRLSNYLYNKSLVMTQIPPDSLKPLTVEEGRLLLHGYYTAFEQLFDPDTSYCGGGCTIL